MWRDYLINYVSMWSNHRWMWNVRNYLGHIFIEIFRFFFLPGFRFSLSFLFLFFFTFEISFCLLQFFCFLLLVACRTFLSAISTSFNCRLINVSVEQKLNKQNSAQNLKESTLICRLLTLIFFLFFWFFLWCAAT